jgi:hypothetical protein
VFLSLPQAGEPTTGRNVLFFQQTRMSSFQQTRMSSFQQTGMSAVLVQRTFLCAECPCFRRWNVFLLAAFDVGMSSGYRTLALPLAGFQVITHGLTRAFLSLPQAGEPTTGRNVLFFQQTGMSSFQQTGMSSFQQTRMSAVLFSADKNVCCTVTIQ